MYVQIDDMKLLCVPIINSPEATKAKCRVNSLIIPEKKNFRREWLMKNMLLRYFNGGLKKEGKTKSTTLGSLKKY